VQIATQDISVIVDYAHTPIVWKTCYEQRDLYFRKGDLYLVVEVIAITKRPKMGQIAAQLADVVVVTSDNPRTEDPERFCKMF